MTPLSLNHLNLPSKDPQAQARWYSENLGFKAFDNFLWSNGTLLVFMEGEPLRNDHVHFGFRAESVEALKEWARTLRERGVEVPAVEGDETYSHVYVHDPEGNKFELFYEPIPQ